MAERRPLVNIGGRIKMLPAADTLPGVGGSTLWLTVTADTAMVAGQPYIANGAANMTLPTAAAAGEQFIVHAKIATRVVSNGNGITHGATVVSPPLTNAMPNGTFETSTGWALGAGCTVAGGKLHCNNNAANATNTYALSLAAGTYDIRYEASDSAQGQFLMRVNQGSLLSGATNSANGAYIDTFVCTGAITSLEVRALRSGSLMDFKIDNITIFATGGNNLTLAAGNTLRLAAYSANNLEVV